MTVHARPGRRDAGVPSSLDGRVAVAAAEEAVAAHVVQVAELDGLLDELVLLASHEACISISTTQLAKATKARAAAMLDLARALARLGKSWLIETGSRRLPGVARTRSSDEPAGQGKSRGGTRLARSETRRVGDSGPARRQYNVKCFTSLSNPNTRALGDNARRVVGLRRSSRANDRASLRLGCRR